MAEVEVRDWEKVCLAITSIRGKLKITAVAEINQAFEASGIRDAAANPEPGNPNDTFIDLYTALRACPRSARACWERPATGGSAIASSRANTRIFIVS